MDNVTRRKFLGTASLAAAGTAMGPWVLRARAQSGPIKIGLVLPYSGVYAVLGESITQGMELVFARENWTVAGRKIEMIKEDDEMKPPVGIRKTEKLIDSDKVDILTGPVHSGILMGMRDKVHDSKTILIVSNAGRRRDQPRALLEVDLPHVVLELAAQPAHGRRGWPRTCPRTCSSPRPNYQAGKDQLDAFKETFVPAGRQDRRRGLSEARRDRLRAVPDEDPPVGRQGRVRVLLGHGRRELREAVRPVRPQADDQAHRRRLPHRARRAARPGQVGARASSPATSTRRCSTTRRTSAS